MANKEVPIVPNFKKVLYERQSNDDTAIGPNFLEQYIPDHIPSITYMEVIPFFAEVFLQLTFISLFLNYFFLLKESQHSKKNIFIITGCVLYVVATTVEAMVNDSMSYMRVWSTFKNSMVLGIVCYVIAPCFKSIYSNHADDSAALLVLLLVFLYILSYDYDAISRKIEKEIFGRPQLKEGHISMFVTIILTVLLSSRLHYIHQIFSLIIMNIVLFYILPKLRRKIYSYSLYSYYICYVILVLLNLWFSMRVDYRSLLITCIIVPVFFIQLYPTKLIINGPWQIPVFTQYNIDKLKTVKFD